MMPRLHAESTTVTTVDSNGMSLTMICSSYWLVPSHMVCVLAGFHMPTKPDQSRIFRDIWRDMPIFAVLWQSCLNWHCDIAICFKMAARQRRLIHEKTQFGD